jgi:hypothetical protein
VTSGLAKRFKRRHVFGAVVLYLVLWGLTQLLGAAHVRATIADKYLPHDDCPRLQRCAWNAVAVAPFIVKGAYFWDSGSLAGEGARVLYAWFGVFTVQIWRWDEIMI